MIVNLLYRWMKNVNPHKISYLYSRRFENELGKVKVKHKQDSDIHFLFDRPAFKNLGRRLRTVCPRIEILCRRYFLCVRENSIIRHLRK